MDLISIETIVWFLTCVPVEVVVRCVVRGCCWRYIAREEAVFVIVIGAMVFLRVTVVRAIIVLVTSLPARPLLVTAARPATLPGGVGVTVPLGTLGRADLTPRLLILCVIVVPPTFLVFGGTAAVGCPVRGIHVKGPGRKNTQVRVNIDQLLLYLTLSHCGGLREKTALPILSVPLSVLGLLLLALLGFLGPTLLRAVLSLLSVRLGLFLLGWGKGWAREGLTGLGAGAQWGGQGGLL